MKNSSRKRNDNRSKNQDLQAKKFLVDLERRRFLINSACAATGAAMALSAGRKSLYAWADSQQQQRFMINIHLPGGWDTNWFHTAFPKSMISTAPDNTDLIEGLTKNLLSSQSLPVPAKGDDPYLRKVDVDANDNIKQYYNLVYTERTKSDKLIPHSQSGHYFGAAAKNAFNGDLSLLTSKSCIWKGIYSGGAHMIPNQHIIHGSASQYAISYSGLIAESLAKTAKRKLHYMQLTATPSDYGANWAMAKGDQIPINCPDYNAFKKLIQKGTNDIANATLYGNVNDSIARLGEQLGKEKLSLSRSKDIYSTFVNFFKGAVDISQLSSSMGGFLQVWQEYAEYARQRLATFHSASFISENISSEITLPLKDFKNPGNNRRLAYNSHYYAPYDSQLVRRGESDPIASSPRLYDSVMSSYESALGTAFSASESSLNISGATASSPAGTRAMIALFAWRFAIAEYLITQGHSTVIDMKFDTGDAHGDNPSELRLLSVVYSLYAKMLSRLNSAQFSSGQSYLDRTSVIMFSEFDRKAAINDGGDLGFRGTNHDQSASILMSGYGVKQGTVVGDRLYGASDGGCAPLEYRPGKIQIVDYKYVFPTLMKIFGVEVPANQITDAEAVTAVLAGY